VPSTFSDIESEEELTDGKNQVSVVYVLFNLCKSSKLSHYGE